MTTITESVCADLGTVPSILGALEERVGHQTFNAWFRHGTRFSPENGHIRLTVPNPFVANWIETHYQPDIAAAIEESTGSARPLVVTIDPGLAGELRKVHLDRQADMVSRATSGRGRARKTHEAPKLRYHLDDFVVGRCNKLAYTAALAIAGNEKAPFSPLFIHGACGVGKTHLLQGICNAVSRLRGGGSVRWRYVTAEQFTNEFITSLKHKKIEQFRARYRKLNLLAGDDIHLLSAKKATQDDHLHTFNAIESVGKQIVMASDAAPKLVGELSEHLVSRFAAGMVVRIDPPDHETRLAILRRKAKQMGVKIEPDALEYAAMRMRGSVRELEGALIKLAAVAKLQGKPATRAMAAEVLADHLARTDSAITVGDIEAAVATYFGITPADIHSSRRTRTVSTARQLAMFLARRHTQMSYPEIGRCMGKNHSSVILAVQKMERLLASGGSVEWMSPMGRKSMPVRNLLEMLTEQIV